MCKGFAHGCLMNTSQWAKKCSPIFNNSNRKKRQEKKVLTVHGQTWKYVDHRHHGRAQEKQKSVFPGFQSKLKATNQPSCVLT